MRTSLLAGIVLIIGGAGSACSGDTALGESRTDEGRAFADAIEVAEGHEMSLRQAFGKDFDAATVVCPYLGAGDVEKALGFSWEGAKDLPLQDDSVNAVVLAQNSDVVHVEVLRRLDVDLCSVGEIGVARIDPAERLRFDRAENSDGSTGWARTGL